jgi:hypothetical protein
MAGREGRGLIQILGRETSQSAVIQCSIVLTLRPWVRRFLLAPSTERE